MERTDMKIKAAAAVLAALAATAAAPATSDAAARPAVSGICSYNLAIFPGSNSNGPTANVSGTITFCGSPTATPAYLVLWKTNAAGVRSFAASGTGEATYQCQGTTTNTFSMDGEIPTGVSYTMAMNCG
jgi:hypothetical protein